MNEKGISRTNLFLIELIIVVLFFAFASIIVMQVFVKASDLADDSMALNGAVIAAQSAAELDKATPIENHSSSERYQYFDENWQPIEHSGGQYILTTTTQMDNRWTGIMATFTYNITSGERLIYQLQAKKYYSSGIASIQSNSSQERGDPNE